jgi:hypothetical protein
VTFRPHPRQAEFMREPARRIIIGGVGRPSSGLGLAWLRKLAQYVANENTKGTP